MAEIKPIKALMYTEKAGPLGKNVCPPYDIISPEEREALIKESPYNVVQLEKPEGEDAYGAAARLLDRWLAQGVLRRDEEEGIFIYGQDFEYGGKRYSLKGIICLCRLYSFDEKMVLPHENTLSKAKADRFELMQATRCNFSSIYSLYNDGEGAVRPVLRENAAKAPDSCFTDGEGVTHSLWRISDKPDIDLITSALAPKRFFIADGHHRYDTALKFRDQLRAKGETGGDWVLMTLVDINDPGLLVLPTHRLVRGIEIDKNALLSSLDADFQIEQYPDVNRAEEILAGFNDRCAFGLYTGGDGFTLLVYKGRALDANGDGGLSALDVSILHDRILEKKLGIDKKNMANQVNLIYIRGVAEAAESVRGYVSKGESALAFLLNPTKVGQIKSVSLAGGKMPQKSTYFYPKLKTGLVMNML